MNDEVHRAQSHIRRLANNNIEILAVAHAACHLIDEGSIGLPARGVRQRTYAAQRRYARQVNYTARRWARRIPLRDDQRRSNATAHSIIRDGRRTAIRSATAVVTNGPAQVIHSTTFVTLMSVMEDMAVLTRAYQVTLDVDLWPIIRSFDDGELTWSEALRAAIDAYRPFGGRDEGNPYQREGCA